MAGRPQKAPPIPGGYLPGAEPFLAAVVAAPADDTVRLVFADWLDENGDGERAEFIRTQIELSRRQPGYEGAEEHRTAFCPEDRRLYERHRFLLARNRTPWLAAFPRWAVAVLWQSFSRGFPTSVHASATQWIERGQWVRQWVPLEEVSIEGGPDEYSQIIKGSSLLGLNRLVLRRVGQEGLSALAASPVLDTVESLVIYGRQRPAPVPPLRDVFASPRLANVRELRVWFDRGGDTLGFVVAGSPHLRNLRVLHLSDAMGDRAARELFDSPNLANVTELDLSQNPIGDIAIRWLVRSKYVTRLAKLALLNTGLTAESGRLLAAWPGLRTIRELDLGGNRLGLEGVRALSESPHLSQLQRLSLSGNLPPNQMADIRSLPGFAHLPGLRPYF